MTTANHRHVRPDDVSVFILWPPKEDTESIDEWPQWVNRNASATVCFWADFSRPPSFAIGCSPATLQARILGSSARQEDAHCTHHRSLDSTARAA
jgi:hypothetical protein